MHFGNTFSNYKVNKPEPVEAMVLCPCGNQMKLVRTKDFSRYFYSCETYPKCDMTMSADNTGKPVGIPADRGTREKRKELFNKLRDFYNVKNPEDQESVMNLIKDNTKKTRITALTYGECVRLIQKLTESNI